MRTHPSRATASVVWAVITVTVAACSTTSDPPAPRASQASPSAGTTLEATTRPTLAPGNGTLDEANPVVEGPLGAAGIHGRPWNASLHDLGERGYVEEEYILAGTSTRLSGGEAPYRTRMLVRRPADPARFNGTVILEWLNVTLGADIETVWPLMWRKLTDDGYAYVGVTVQQVGMCCGPLSLQVWDPVRYGSLAHPGGDYPPLQPTDDPNPDIFRQAIRSLRHPDANPPGERGPSVDPTGGLDVRAVVAVGNSQSAGRLMTYINEGYDAADPVIDAFVLGRSRYHVTYDYGEAPRAPVFLITEEALAPSPEDGDHLIVWEEAGTAHGPQVLWDYLSPMLERDTGSGLSAAPGCSYNRGSADYTARAMLDATQRYLTSGTLPPRAPRLERDSNGAVRRDADGLAIGGLRQPFVEVPVAFNSAEREPGCNNFLQGIHRPWPASTIRARYADHDTYLRAITETADRLHHDGFLTDEDRSEVIDKARGFRRPWESSCREDPNCIAEPPQGL